MRSAVQVRSGPPSIEVLPGTKMTFENSEFARQFRRANRQYKRCQSAYVPGDQVGVFSQDRDDAENVEQLFSQFFIECYHLKDWIKEDNMLPVSIRSCVEGFVNNSRPLSLAGDIANSEKHLVLNRPPKVSKKVRIRSIPIIFGPIGTYPLGGIYKFNISVDTEIEREPIDALDLASQCMSEWKQFISKNDLDY